jgi:glycosyltransferase involved in cell wall biosynthesis
MRICLVYDHLYPRSIGGMERWFSALAAALAAAGHEVTYVTTGASEVASAKPEPIPGVRLVGLGRLRPTYTAGRRRLLPPLLFGLAVFRHLRRAGHRYDVVQVASMPYFPLIAAALLRRRRGYGLVVAWPEVWTRGYWRAYAGPVVGRLGWLVQRYCARVPQMPICMAELHAGRLAEMGQPERPLVFRGLYSGPVGAVAAAELEPIVVYAGRFVREKRVPLLVRAFAEALPTRPELRLTLFGDGPQRSVVENLVAELGLAERVRVAGIAPQREVELALARAACVATASEREGYGLLVVEAAARGTPSVVVAGPENASLELVREGINGAVAARPEPGELAAALLRASSDEALRGRTLRWFEQRAGELRMDGSLAALVERLEVAASAGRRRTRAHE